MKKREFIKQSLITATGIPVLLSSIKSQARPDKLFPGMNNPSPDPQNRYFKEAYHYSMSKEGAQCELCPNFCFIKPGKRGSCRARINQDGKLMTAAYGNPSAVHIDPIEKKPLFHFLPASRAYSIATAGCVLSCLNCQNWELSQATPGEVDSITLMPTKVVEEALDNGCQNIAYTYSEPTAFYEYTFDTAKVARHRGIKNLMISCGYINEDPLRELLQFVDAANINLKSFSDEIYHKLNGGALEPILRTLKIYKEMGVWLEITNLVIPTWTDDMDMIRRMSQWLVKEGFADYPLHFNRFFPLYKLTHLPSTPAETLEQARSIAMSEGMKYVYVGNIPGSEYEDTFCPNCKKKVINRKGFSLLENNLKGNSCRFCGEKIAGVWQ